MLTADVQKFLQNPNCSCNMRIYQNVLQHAEEQVRQYFPNKKYVSPQTTLDTIMQNSWIVINCNVRNLEDELKKLKHGRKQIAMARYGDEVTVIVNELEAVY